MKNVVLLIMLLYAGLCQAQEVNSLINKGNEAYKQQQYEKAAEAYKEALEADPNNATAAFNLGNALFKSKKYDEAIKQFEEIKQKTTDKSLQSQSFYNKGVSFSQQKKLEESIEAYKQSLRLNPVDSLARDNLQRALNEKKQQQQQQQQQQDQKKQQDKKNQPQPKQNKLNQQQVQQLLKALEEQEKKLQEKVMKKAPVPGQPDKDW